MFYLYIYEYFQRNEDKKNDKKFNLLTYQTENRFSSLNIDLED